LPTTSGIHVAEDAVAGLVALGIDLEKLLEMGVDVAPASRQGGSWLDEYQGHTASAEVVV
jgi:hypothetical protein